MEMDVGVSTKVGLGVDAGIVVGLGAKTGEVVDSGRIASGQIGEPSLTQW